MPFIQNVSYTDFRDGSHKDPGSNSMAIQILARDQLDFGFGGVVSWPVSPFEFKEIHRFHLDDTFGESAITSEEAFKVMTLLKRALANDWNVIVHCAAGVSRSGAVCEVGTILGFEDTRVYRNPNIEIKKKLLYYM